MLRIGGECQCPGACVAAAVFAHFVFRQIEQLLKLLTTEILHPDSQAPNGVKSHFIEIFLEELAKVGANEVRGQGCRQRAGWGWRLSPFLGVCE